MMETPLLFSKWGGIKYASANFILGWLWSRLANRMVKSLNFSLNKRGIVFLIGKDENPFCQGE